MFAKFSVVECESTVSVFRKRKFLCCVHQLHRVGAWNKEVSCRKKRTVMHVQSFSFTNINLSLFCCSHRCCLCPCLTSLLLWSRIFATVAMWAHSSLLSITLLQTTSCCAIIISGLNLIRWRNCTYRLLINVFLLCKHPSYQVRGYLPEFHTGMTFWFCIMFPCLHVFCHLMTNMTRLSWIDKNYVCTTRSSPPANQFHIKISDCFVFTWYHRKIWVLFLCLHETVAKLVQSEFSFWYNNRGELMLVWFALTWHIFVMVSCKQIHIIKGFL